MKQKRRKSFIINILTLILSVLLFISYSEKSIEDPPETKVTEKTEHIEAADISTPVFDFLFNESPSMQEIAAEDEITNETEKETGEEIDLDLLINNDTSYQINTEVLINKAEKVEFTNPTVLIVHTHGSEAYTPDEKNNFIPDDVDRTIDKDYNVVRVGNELERLLEEAGINVIHDESLHDYPTYSGSYSRSLKTIEAYMEKDPSINIVIDLHRDAFLSGDGTKYRTYAEVNGEPSAQLMFVIGTQEGGLKHQDWEDNLSFALKMQIEAEEKYPKLMRPIHLRSERFNQHCTSGSMILEVGSSGNSLDEALTAVRYFADILISSINS